MGISSYLTHTGTVSRRTYTTDGAGGRTETWGNVTSTLACRVSGKSSTQRALEGSLDGVGNYKVFTLTTADLKPNDRLVVSSLTYEVLSVTRDSLGNHLEWEVQLVEDKA